MKFIFSIVLFQCILYPLFSQDDPCKFSNKPTHIDTTAAKTKTTSIQHILISNVNLSALKLENASFNQSRSFKIALSSNINVKTDIKINQCLINIELNDISGFDWIPDSVFQFNKDLVNFKFAIQPPEKKKVVMNFNSMAQSQKVRTFVSTIDSIGRQTRKQSTGFFSPGTLLVNGGLSYSGNARNKVEFGLASFKVNCMANRKLNSIQNTNELAGIPIEKGYLLTGGVNLQSVLEKNFGRLLTWENSSVWFYPISKEPKLEVQIKNAIIWKPVSNLQASLRTNYSYDEKRWPPGLWSAEFTLGFVFNQSN
jgi:hypothetical protein